MKLLRRVRKEVPAAILILSIATYICAMIYITFLKYYTFHATYLDLGLENQVLWLLSHGGISYYYSSGFVHIYPLQFEQPFMFLVLVIYYLFPSPFTLLGIQTIALGLTPIPIYYSLKTTTRNRWLPLIVSVSYLVYFPVISANMFDYHIFSFIPLFYMMMVYRWIKLQRFRMIGWAVLTSMISPLALLLVVFFLVFVLFERLFNNWEKRIKTKYSELLHLTFVILALLVVFAIYHTLNHLYIPGGLVGSNLSLSQILIFHINKKLILFLFLFGAMAFVPLLEFKTIFFIAPYAGYVMLSTSSSLVTVFGLQYTIFAVGPIYLGTILYFSRVHKMQMFTKEDRKSENQFEPRAVYEKVRTKYGDPLVRIIILFVIVVVIFSVTYSPVSPLDQKVQGGYFNGNYDLKNITSITPQVEFLHKTIALIPQGASVVTQNNIPQLSSRESLRIISSGNSPSFGSDFILVNTQLNYFTDSGADLSYVVNAFNTGSYGILAEGQGALLLERNYSGSPVLFAPYNVNLSASNFATFGGSYRTSNAIVSDNGSMPSFMWYGPYMEIPPGEYFAEFFVSVRGGNSSLDSNITLQIYDKPVMYAEKNITYSAIQGSENITAVSMYFNTSEFATGLEFRGIRTTTIGQVAFFGVRLTQLST